jgi:hypothetical protein
LDYSKLILKGKSTHKFTKLGMVTHGCNPPQEDCEFEASLGYRARPHLKNTKQESKII